MERRATTVEVNVDTVDYALIVAASCAAGAPVGAWAARTLARAAAVALDVWLPTYIEVIDNEGGELYAE